MENYTPNTFLNKLSGHYFDSEEAMVRYFETISPAIFEINKTRIVKELRTTANDGTLSNLADLVILDNFNRTQALVAFEFKLDKSIENFKGGSYEDAENQLHKYCQQLKVPYGVLISDKICEIFKYTFRGSIFNSEKVFCLPSLTEIEKEINFSNYSKPVQINIKTQIVKFIVVSIFVLLFRLLFGLYLVNRDRYPRLQLCELSRGIKGNVSLNKDGTIENKIYHIYGSKYYHETSLKEADGDRCFRLEQDAISSGFRKSMGY